jgi:hypothetical protein
MTNRTHGPIILFAALSAIALVWLVFLPALSTLDSVRQRIDKNHAAGIDPTAVFYTDHPGMADIERSMEASVGASTGWFWKPSF